MKSQNEYVETKEIWVPCQFIANDGTVEEHHGYEVSNLGRVRSLNYHSTRKSKVMMPGAKVRTHGTYYQVRLRKNKKSYWRNVHRLVLSSFCSKDYFNGAVVDHIDSNPSNNNLSNLRWVTQQENTSTSHFKEAISKANSNHPSFSKRVKVTFLDDIHSEIFPSAREADRALGLPKRTVASYISQRCNHYKKLNLLFEYI